MPDSEPDWTDKEEDTGTWFKEESKESEEDTRILPKIDWNSTTIREEKLKESTRD